MDREAVLKKLKFGFSEHNLIINAPHEYLEILKGADFDQHPEDEKLQNYGFVQVFATSQSEIEELILSVAKAGK